MEQAKHSHGDDRVRFEQPRTWRRSAWNSKLTQRSNSRLIGLCNFFEGSFEIRVQTLYVSIWAFEFCAFEYFEHFEHFDHFEHGENTCVELLAGSCQCHQSVTDQSWMFIPQSPYPENITKPVSRRASWSAPTIKSHSHHTHNCWCAVYTQLENGSNSSNNQNPPITPTTKRCSRVQPLWINWPKHFTGFQVTNTTE